MREEEGEREGVIVFWFLRKPHIYTHSAHRLNTERGKRCGVRWMCWPTERGVSVQRTSREGSWFESLSALMSSVALMCVCVCVVCCCRFGLPDMPLGAGPLQVSRRIPRTITILATSWLMVRPTAFPPRHSVSSNSSNYSNYSNSCRWIDQQHL